MKMKKLWAMALALAMAVAIVPGMAVGVSAAEDTITVNGTEYNILSENLIYNGDFSKTTPSGEYVTFDGWKGGYVSTHIDLGTAPMSDGAGRVSDTSMAFSYTQAENGTSAFITTPARSGMSNDYWAWYPWNVAADENHQFAVISNWFKNEDGSYVQAKKGTTYYIAFKMKATSINSGVRNEVVFDAFTKNGDDYETTPPGALADVPNNSYTAALPSVLTDAIRPAAYLTVANKWKLMEKVVTATDDGYFAFQNFYANDWGQMSFTDFTIYEVEKTVETTSVISGNKPVLSASVNWNLDNVDFTTDSEIKTVSVSGTTADGKQKKAEVTVYPCTDDSNSGKISSTKGQNPAMFHRFNGDIKGKASFEFDVTYNVDAVIGNHYVGIGSKASVAADGPVFSNGGNAIGLQGVNNTTGTLNFYGQSQFKITKGTKYRVFITTDTTTSTYSATVTDPDGNVVGSVNDAVYRNSDLPSLDGLSVVVNGGNAGDDEIVVENFRVSNTDGKNFTVSITGAGGNDKPYNVVSATSAGIPVPSFDGYVLKTRVAGDNIVNTRAGSAENTLKLEYAANENNLGTWAIRNNTPGNTALKDMNILGAHDSFTDKIKGSSNNRDEAGIMYGDTGSAAAQGGAGAAMSQAQSSDVTSQLNYGVRFFDIRLSRQEDGVFWTRHGLISEEFEGIAYTIAQFAKENPGEVIILDFHDMWDALYTEDKVITNNEVEYGKTKGDDNRYAYSALVSLLKKTGVTDYAVSGKTATSATYDQITENGTKAAIVMLSKNRGANCFPDVFMGEGNNFYNLYQENSRYDDWKLGSLTLSKGLLTFLNDNYLSNAQSNANKIRLFEGHTTGSNLLSDAQGDNGTNAKLFKEANFQSWMENYTVMFLDGIDENTSNLYLPKLTEYTRDGFDGIYTNTVEGVTVEGPTASVPFSTELTAARKGKDYTFRLTQFKDGEAELTGAVKLTFPDATGGIAGLKTVVYKDSEEVGSADSGNNVVIENVTKLNGVTYTVTTEAINAKADAKLGYDGKNLTLDFTLDDVASKLDGAESFNVTVTNQDGAKVGEAKVTKAEPNVLLTPKDSNAIYTATIEAVKSGVNYSVGVVKASLYSEVVENLESVDYTGESSPNSDMIAKANEVISHGGVYFTDSEQLNEQTAKIVNVEKGGGAVTVTVKDPYSGYGIGFILSGGNVVIGSNAVAGVTDGKVYQSFTINTTDNTVALSGEAGAVTLSLDSVNIEFLETLIDEADAGTDSAQDFVPEL